MFNATEQTAKKCAISAMCVIIFLKITLSHPPNGIHLIWKFRKYQKNFSDIHFQDVEKLQNIVCLLIFDINTYEAGNTVMLITRCLIVFIYNYQDGEYWNRRNKFLIMIFNRTNSSWSVLSFLAWSFWLGNQMDREWSDRLKKIGVKTQRNSADVRKLATR